MERKFLQKVFYETQWDYPTLRDILKGNIANYLYSDIDEYVNVDHS